MTFTIMAWESVGGVGDGFVHFVGALESCYSEVGPQALNSSWQGMVVTQAQFFNRNNSEALVRLGEGATAQEAVDVLLAGDSRRGLRQSAALDKQTGDMVVFTGRKCDPWSGSLIGEGSHNGREHSYAVFGNCLTGPEVLQAMEEAYLAEMDKPLHARVLLALAAGRGAGGDRRINTAPLQSAGLYAHMYAHRTDYNIHAIMDATEAVSPRLKDPTPALARTVANSQRRLIPLARKDGYDDPAMDAYLANPPNLVTLVRQTIKDYHEPEKRRQLRLLAQGNTRLNSGSREADVEPIEVAPTARARTLTTPLVGKNSGPRPS